MHLECIYKRRLNEINKFLRILRETNRTYRGIGIFTFTIHTLYKITHPFRELSLCQYF